MKRYLDMIALSGIKAFVLCAMWLAATLIYVAWNGEKSVIDVATGLKEWRLLSFAFVCFFVVLTVGGLIILLTADIVRAIANIIRLPSFITSWMELERMPALKRCVDALNWSMPKAIMIGSFSSSIFIIYAKIMELEFYDELRGIGLIFTVAVIGMISIGVSREFIRRQSA